MLRGGSGNKSRDFLTRTNASFPHNVNNFYKVLIFIVYQKRFVLLTMWITCVDIFKVLFPGSEK